MSGYLQRLLDRTAPAISPAATADTSRARPAFASQSPIAAADQRLNDPSLAALIGAAPPADSGEAGLFGGEAAGVPDRRSETPARPRKETPRDTADNRRDTKTQGGAFQVPSVTRPALGEGGAKQAFSDDPVRPDTTPPTAAPHDRDQHGAPPPAAADATSEHPAATEPSGDIARPSDEPQLAKVPTPVRPDRLVPPVLRIVERQPMPAPEVTPTEPVEPARSPDAEDPSEPPVGAPLPEARSEAPQTVEPPPLPTPPAPPPVEPATVIVQMPPPAPPPLQVEQRQPESAPPEPAQPPRPRPRTAAEASVIGALPLRRRVRSLFGVTRR